MITKISIENFKSIGDKQAFELSDITLLYGPNSAGKSSVIQALRYAYEVLANKDPDPMFSNLDGESVYLGGFKNLVNQRDLSKKIIIGISIEPSSSAFAGDYSDFCRMAKHWMPFMKNTNVFFERMIDSVLHSVSGAYIREFFLPGMFQCGFLPVMQLPKSLGLRFGVQWNKESNKAELDFMIASINNIFVWGQFGDEAIFKQESLNLIPNFDYDLSGESGLYGPWFCGQLEKALSIDPNLFAEIDISTEPKLLVDDVDDSAENFNEETCVVNMLLSSGRFERINNKTVPSKLAWEKLSNAKALRQKAESESFKHFKNLQEATMPLIKHIDGAGWYMPWCGNPLQSSLQPDYFLESERQTLEFREEWFPGFKEIVGDQNDLAIWKERAQCFDHVVSYLATLAVVVRSNVADCLKSLLHIGPLREHRANVRASESSSEGWYTGRAAWRTLEDKNVDIEAISRWLMSQELFDTGYSILRTKQKTIDNLEEFLAGLQVDPNSLNSLLERAATSTRIFVIDRYGLKLNSDEVGTGISQLIPILVAALYRGSICFIEQPELHLHPRCQLVIGDLLIHGRNSNRQLIVETHSEHLALRLLRRIRETSDNCNLDEKLKLKPDQLSVLYVQPTDSGSKIMRLRVDESGEFIDRWPKGFFDERAEELF
jgi:predicted ATPase